MVFSFPSSTPPKIMTIIDIINRNYLEQLFSCWRSHIIIKQLQYILNKKYQFEVKKKVILLN